MRYDPSHPYDVPERNMEPPDEGEAYFQDVWVVRLYERPRTGGQRIEINAWTFTDKHEAEKHAEKIIEDPDLDHDEYIYTVVIDEDQQECDPPEPDWDSAPGGHDDY